MIKFLDVFENGKGSFWWEQCECVEKFDHCYLVRHKVDVIHTRMVFLGKALIDSSRAYDAAAVALVSGTSKRPVGQDKFWYRSDCAWKV